SLPNGRRTWRASVASSRCVRAVTTETVTLAPRAPLHPFGPLGPSGWSALSRVFSPLRVSLVFRGGAARAAGRRRTSKVLSHERRVRSRAARLRACVGLPPHSGDQAGRARSVRPLASLPRRLAPLFLRASGR